MIRVISQVDEVIEFAWKLSKDDRRASYPRMGLREVLEEELSIWIERANGEVIAYYESGQVIGVCCYYWIDEQRYAETAAFLIERDYAQVADQFLRHIRDRLPGYRLDIGVPVTNRDANTYFQNKGIECMERSIVTKLYNLQASQGAYGDSLEQIGTGEFAEYAVFHDRHAIPAEMFYDSKNLLAKLDLFRVYALRRDGKIHGSIFARLCERFVEIYGLFLDQEHKDKGLESVLIRGLLERLFSEFGPIKEVLYFIDEDSQAELAAALDAGFAIKEEYRLYRYEL